MTEKKVSFWQMRANEKDKAEIFRLAKRWRVSEADAVRIAVSELLQSGRVPNIPARMRRPLAIRRKVTEA